MRRIRRNNFQTFSKPYYKTEFSVAPSLDQAEHLLLSLFFLSVIPSREAVLTAGSRGWRTGSLCWFLSERAEPRGAGAAALVRQRHRQRQRERERRSGPPRRPLARRLHGGLGGSHKGSGPLGHPRPAMPSPPPALPWLLAACCLCALPRGSGTSRHRGAAGTPGDPWEGSAPLEPGRAP